MKTQFEEYENKINLMKNENEEKEKIAKEKNEMEKQLKDRLKRLQSQKNERNKLFQSEVIKDESQITAKNEQQLEKKLMNIVKKIYKFTDLIDDLKRNVDLDLFLSKNLIDHYNDPNTPINIFIRVNNYEEGNICY